MDLANLDISSGAEAGSELHLEHPVSGEKLFSDDGKPCIIRIQGRDSRAFRTATHKISNERLGQRHPPSSEKMDENAAELLASITLGWQNIDWDGKPFKFSRENALKLYTAHRWVREQVDEFAGDRAHFLRAPEQG